jgi:hypothetical protein
MAVFPCSETQTWDPYHTPYEAKHNWGGLEEVKLMKFVGWALTDDFGIELGEPTET